MLWFAPAERPDAESLRAWRRAASEAARWRIIAAHAAAGSLELLSDGMSFVLEALQPAAPVTVEPAQHGYDITAGSPRPGAAICLQPTADLRSARALMPVVRAQVALGCDLAALPGVLAVGWPAAGTIMSPDYFRRAITAWLAGGAFPGLGLTALTEGRGGEGGLAMRSVGLRTFTGFELEVACGNPGGAGDGRAAAAKLALRAIHGLVEGLCDVPGLPDLLGEPDLVSAWSEDGRLLRIGTA